LNPYLNFHRPCFFPEVILDARGKQKKLYRYERMMTPSSRSPTPRASSSPASPSSTSMHWPCK
ncbi:MAG: hypothetical protein ACREX3_09900, partial [Gammaproteobacteria bacterium]